MSMRKRTPSIVVAMLLVLSLVAGCGGPAQQQGQAQGQGEEQQTAKEKVTLTVSTHWGDAFIKEMQPLLDAYEQETGVHIEWKAVPFTDFFQKVQVEALSGDPPDLWHLYSLWGPQMANSGAIAEAPSAVQELVKSKFTEAAQSGVTFGGKIYGTPTEIDNYLLLYNKRLLAEAGYDAPPSTWDEFYEIAKATTKVASDGTIQQAGVGFMKGWDSAVVHPFMTLVYSNGGQFLSDDGKRVMLDSPEAIEALELQVKLIQEKLADPALDYQKFFPAGKIAMVITAPFVKGSFSEAMGEDWKNVGVAPVPHSEGHESKTISYTWFWSVSEGSQHKEEAWKFVQWLNQRAEGESASRMGNFLAHFGIIPSQTSDFELFKDDPFLKVFVDELPNTIAEPNLEIGQEMKTALMREIEAAWYGKKEPAAALKAATEEMNSLLQQAQ